MSNVLEFTVNGEVYGLDVDRLTFAEARAFESHSGVSFVEAMENPKTRTTIDALQALVWIAVKRKEPTTKFSDLDDVELGSIVSDEEEAEPDPTRAEAVTPIAPAAAVAVS
jgi:hypothetical protein